VGRQPIIGVLDGWASADPALLPGNSCYQRALCSNLPVGMFALEKFASDKVSPRQADVFVLFTDGLLEVTNKSDAEFGLEGIKAVLRQASTRR
jgi:serine phosphatase RsbU (regulator of sigma subunit)